MNLPSKIPGKKPFNESLTIVPDSLILDNRLSTSSRVVMIAIIGVRQYYETNEICSDWLCEELGITKTVMKKSLNQLKEFKYL